MVHLENSQLSPLTSNEDVKPQYGNINKSQKNFIHNTKYDSHDRVPKIGLEHKYASFA